MIFYNFCSYIYTNIYLYTNNRYLMIESNTYYFKESLKYDNFIKSLADEYDLITFYYNRFINRKIHPIHNTLNLNLLGYDETYFIDLLSDFPVKKNIKLIKLIRNKSYHVLQKYKGNKSILLLNSLNKVLKKNNNVKSSYIDFSKLSKGKITNSELFDVLFILEYDIILKQKNNRNNEVSLFQKRLLVLKENLELLKKGGSLYLEYFNCSLEKSLNLMVIVSSYFKSYKFISSQLSKNTLEGGFYVLEGFKGLKDDIFEYVLLESNKIKNDKFVLFIDKIQKNKYNNYNLFLKKCNYVKNSLKRKGMNYFINYQISLGVDWCNENNLSINNYYKKKLKRETTIHFLKKIFYPIEKLNYKKLELYYDSFYSVTYVKDYNETLHILNKYIDFNKEKVIVDACANVGVSTIALSYSFSKVYGIEISKERCKCLVNNIKVYGRKNIKVICDDYLKIENHFSNDLVFFDPPWSGIFYKIENIMELYLGSTNIKECLKKQKKFILKAPFNYNYHDLKINNLIVEKLSSFLLIIRI